MVKCVHVQLGGVLGILEHHNVLPLEWLRGQEVLPVLGLDVELVDGLVAEHVAGGTDGGHVNAVGKHLTKRKKKTMGQVWPRVKTLRTC